jgi:SAM-dependent methyltransferase
MISAKLLDVVQCPDCEGTIAAVGSGFSCRGCGRSFDGSTGVLDLRPTASFTEQTKYLDEALHTDARHATVAPPLLGAKIRNDMLRKFLGLGPGDRAVDLGCGSGRGLAWNADSGAALTGIDISPYFAREAIARCDLVLGDLRRLPLRDGAFTKAWSLDVLEHVSLPALRDVLSEAHRVLAPGGALFIYTHVRKNSWIAGGVRLVNRVARGFERLGLIDLRQERLRKSDHVNPLTDHDQLATVAAESGFTIERITYYTPIVGATVENIFVRVAERSLAKRAAKKQHLDSNDEAATKTARTEAQARLAKRGLAYRGLVGLTGVMKLDLVLFGRVRSGPFFALMRKAGPKSEARGQRPEA